jgi:hypothetical protein
MTRRDAARTGESPEGAQYVCGTPQGAAVATPIRDLRRANPDARADAKLAAMPLRPRRAAVRPHGGCLPNPTALTHRPWVGGLPSTFTDVGDRLPPCMSPT